MKNALSNTLYIYDSHKTHSRTSKALYYASLSHTMQTISPIPPLKTFIYHNQLLFLCQFQCYIVLRQIFSLNIKIHLLPTRRTFCLNRHFHYFVHTVLTIGVTTLQVARNPFLQVVHFIATTTLHYIIIIIIIFNIGYFIPVFTTIRLIINFLALYLLIKNVALPTVIHSSAGCCLIPSDSKKLCSRSSSNHYFILITQN